MNAVNRPGSLACSAARIVSCHAERYELLSGEYSSAFGNLPCEKATMISMAASAPWPPTIMSCHFRPVGSAMMFGFAGQQIREEAHVVGVVGDDEKVERPRKFRRLARTRP